jgi:hypothetical protein
MKEVEPVEEEGQNTEVEEPEETKTEEVEEEVVLSCSI